MSALKNMAVDAIDTCIERGGGRTTAARLSVKFAALGHYLPIPEVATLAESLGYQVTPRHVSFPSGIRKVRQLSYFISHKHV